MSAVLHATLVILSGGAFLWRRELYLLGFFQQQEYEGRRFWDWCRANRAIDRRGATISIPVAVGLMFARSWPLAALAYSGIGAVCLILMARIETDPRFVGKKKLVLTPRAKRIHRTAFGLSIATIASVAIVAAAVAGSWAPSVTWASFAIVVQLAPGMLVLATWVLARGEKRVQNSFYRQAKVILEQVRPQVIAITGSYGKTSTKHILGTLLSADAPTFQTSRSINTVMGVTRELREKLKPYHKWAIVEMGAYQPRSIRRLCELTPPNAAIITAVGIMHLERFGSPERVYEAKSELAQAIPEGGILVCNGDDIGARRMAAEYRKASTLLYGFDGDDLDCKMSRVCPTQSGTKYVLRWRGTQYEGTTGLYGRPMLSNLMAAFSMAAALGIHPEVLLALARGMQPPENRLQVVVDGDVTWIHDAYNSNPTGFAAALELLGQLPGRRRILVSPGMVELGEMQYAENRRVAELAARLCDLFLVVGDTNREALTAGLRTGGATDSAIQNHRTRDEALAALSRNRRTGDVILIENDLPDLYEGKLTL